VSSAAIRFACPVCAGNIRAPAGQLGHEVLCPHCGNTVTVPGPDQPAVSASQQSPPKIESATQPVVERPKSKEPNIDPDAPIRIDDDRPQPGEFAVTCPTCGTRVAATPNLIGQAVRCPDCYSSVPVLPSEARPLPKSQPTRFDDDVTFSPAVPTPRYIPPATSGVNPAELYGQDATEVSSAAESTSSDQEFTVSCPICHTRIGARPSQIGRNIRCPDCETEFNVHPPRQKPKQDRVTLEEGEEFRMSELFERPKYQSTTRGSVSRDELDIVELNEAERLPPAPEPAIPSPKSSAGKIDFFVTCPTCASRVGARYDQVGKTIRCSDCYSDVVVTAPRTRKSATAVETEADTDEEQIDIPHHSEPAAPPMAARSLITPVAPPSPPSPPTPATPKPVQDVYAEQTREAMGKAEREADEVEDKLKLEDLPPFKQLLIVLSDVTLLIRIVYLSVGLIFELWLASVVSSMFEHGHGEMTAPITFFMFIVAIPVVGYIFKTIINVVQVTAVGQVRIEDWYAEDFYAALSSVFQAFVAFGFSSMPGGILGSALYSAGVPAIICVVLFPLSIFLLFPFVLLSQLEGEHPFYIISLPVARSIRLAPTAWIRCYCEGFILFLLTGALLCLPILSSFLCDIVVAFGLVAIAMLFARSIGILAYACNRALLRDSLRREELASAPQSSR